MKQEQKDKELQEIIEDLEKLDEIDRDYIKIFIKAFLEKDKYKYKAHLRIIK